MSNARYEIIDNKDGTGYYVKKQDAGKPRLDLVPLEIIEAIGDVMTEALKVYEEESWRTVEPKRYIAAFTRHWIKYRKDKNSVAEDTGIPHLWHAAANIAFLITLEDLQKRSGGVE